MDAVLVQAIAALYLACGYAYNDPRRAGGESLYQLAPIDGHPEVGIAFDQLRASAARDDWSSLPPVVQRALALRASGHPRLLSFRLGGTTPGSTAVMLRRAISDRKMGVSRLTQLLLDSSLQ